MFAKQLQRLPWYDSPTDPWYDSPTDPWYDSPTDLGNNVYRWTSRAVTSWQPHKVYFVKLGGATQKVLVD